MLPVGTAPLTLSSLLALAIYLLSGNCFRDRADWQGQEWVLPLMVLIILPWAGMQWSSSPFGQSLEIAEKSHYWLFAFVAASAMKSERVLRNVLVCFVSGTLITAFMRFLHSHEIIPKSAYLDKAFLGSYITYSLLVVITIVLLAFFYRKMSTLYGKLMIVTLMVVLVLAITQLNGRSGYLALSVLSPWICITMFGKRRVIPILCGLLLMFTLMFTSQRVRKRIVLIPKEIKLYQSGFVSSYKQDDGSSIPSSVGLHLQMWRDSLEIFQQFPLFGAGTNGCKYESNKVYPSQGFTHPHNSYLYVSASYGLAGLALYGWLLVVTAKRAWRTREHLSGYSILAFLSVILIGSLTDTLILSVAPGILLGFTVGIPTQQSSRQI
jgi:O-antigen ligase